jgi:hypothetical protein
VKRREKHVRAKCDLRSSLTSNALGSGPDRGEIKLAIYHYEAIIGKTVFELEGGLCWCEGGGVNLEQRQIGRESIK